MYTALQMKVNGDAEQTLLLRTTNKMSLVIHVALVECTHVSWFPIKIELFITDTNATIVQIGEKLDGDNEETFCDGTEHKVTYHGNIYTSMITTPNDNNNNNTASATIIQPYFYQSRVSCT